MFDSWSNVNSLLSLHLLHAHWTVRVKPVQVQSLFFHHQANAHRATHHVDPCSVVQLVVAELHELGSGRADLQAITVRGWSVTEIERVLLRALLDACLSELMWVSGLLALATWLVKVNLVGHHRLTVLQHLTFLAQRLVLILNARIGLARLILTVLADNYHRLPLTC